MRSTPTALTLLAAITLSTHSVYGKEASYSGPVMHNSDEMRKFKTPWQTEDGIIHFRDEQYNSWREYFDARSRQGDINFHCGVPEYDIEAWAEHQAFLPPSDCSMSNTNPAQSYDPSNGVFRIPCVVHVIRNDSGSQGNISEAMVQSGIRILNEDFKAIAGTNGGNGTNCEIEFYLATVDPDGNETNGITYSNNTNWYNDQGAYYDQLAWDPDNYMNIYTNTASGALGYVPWLPMEGSPGSNADRVVVLWESYGDNAPIGSPYNKGRTLTHEVGHYLGLHHTFNGGCGGNCSSSGDLICDTPPQDQATFGCSGSSCSGTPPDDNYMDYSDDLCMERFTPNQSRRMRCALINYRPLLAEEGEGEIEYISLEQYGTNPTLVAPDGVTLRVRINELQQNGYEAGSGRLYISTGGSYQSVPLVSEGSGIYGANTSELECGSTLMWFFTADDVNETTLRLPTGTGVFSAFVADEFGPAFSDNGETAVAYSVTGTASDGEWTRGDPIGCDRNDPATDGDGSGRCWVTDNSSDNDCDSDVDDGFTRLTSPSIDASGGNATVSYTRYFSSSGGGPNCPAGFVADCQGTCFPQAVYDDWQGDSVCDDGTFVPSEYGYNDAPEGVAIFLNCDTFNCDDGDCSGCDGNGGGSGGTGDGDYLSIELSNNGTAWVELERVESGDDTEGTWVSKTFAVADYVTPTSNVQIRFTAVDVGSETIVEAAIDSVVLEVLSCGEDEICIGDLNGDGLVNGVDLSLILGNWGLNSAAADINEDGTVDGIDLSLLLGNWGLCPN